MQIIIQMCFVYAALLAEHNMTLAKIVPSIHGIFHGIGISMENSTEFHLIHGIPWNFSMEFHEIFHKHLTDFFHYIFHGNPWKIQWNSMEFH
jgi:hypothetical protein